MARKITPKEIDDEDYQVCDDCGGSGFLSCDNCKKEYFECMCEDEDKDCPDCVECHGDGLIPFDDED